MLSDFLSELFFGCSLETLPPVDAATFDWPLDFGGLSFGAVTVVGAALVDDDGAAGDMLLFDFVCCCPENEDFESDELNCLEKIHQ